jgi:integrase
MESDFRRRFIPRWKDLPVTEITHGHIVDVIDETVAEGHRAQAFNSLTELRMFFRWVKARPAYGLKHLPTSDFDTASIIGPTPTRDRTFDEIEWRAFWLATEKFEYPHREIYQLLALTGLRLREVANCSWTEVDLERAIIEIPRERMKGKKEKKLPHDVPLCPKAVEIFESLPKFESGEFCFSTTGGKKPATSFSYAKSRFDKLMLAELRELKSNEANKPDDILMPEWVVHDIRRSVRTELARLRIPQQVAERLLAHRPQGIVGKYDRHDYWDERVEAINTWANKLAAIVNPPPSNVIAIRA